MLFYSYVILMDETFVLPKFSLSKQLPNLDIITDWLPVKYNSVHNTSSVFQKNDIEKIMNITTLYHKS